MQNEPWNVNCVLMLKCKVNVRHKLIYLSTVKIDTTCILDIFLKWPPVNLCSCAPLWSSEVSRLFPCLKCFGFRKSASFPFLIFYLEE